MDCFVCQKNENKSQLLIIKVTQSGANQKIECTICGNYYFDTDAELGLNGLSESDRKQLSAIIRERQVRDRTIITLERETAEMLIKEFPIKSVPEKLNHFLFTLSILTSEPGNPVKLDSRYDYPLAYASGVREINYLHRALYSQGYLEEHNLKAALITPKGWERISYLTEHSAESNKVFVAMNFHKDYLPLWKIISDTLIDLGYTPIRSDKEEHVDLIDDYILTQIRESKFIVAEFTGHKHGVYFEAGFARGLGTPVIWVCSKEDSKKLHFDVNHYNQIEWEDHNDLNYRLKNRIKELMGAITVTTD